MSARLLHVSESVLSALRSDVERNLDRYLEGDFSDREKEPGWRIELGVEFDLNALAKLDGKGASARADLENMRLIGHALANLPPAVAKEERIWVRLAHIECFEYSRDRWLRNKSRSEQTIKDIHTHFFARTWTGVRDDHALSRLWWTAHIVRQARPDDWEDMLEVVMRSADIRSNIIERAWLGGRTRFLSNLLVFLKKNPAVTQTERAFRTFIKTVNRQGGGVVFEALGDDKIQGFLARCAESLS